MSFVVLILLVFAWNVKVISVKIAFKIIHDLKKDSKHIKENIDSFVPIELKCAEHPEFQMYLFCIDDKGK